MPTNATRTTTNYSRGEDTLLNVTLELHANTHDQHPCISREQSRHLLRVGPLCQVISPPEKTNSRRNRAIQSDPDCRCVYHYCKKLFDPERSDLEFWGQLLVSSFSLHTPHTLTDFFFRGWFRLLASNASRRLPLVRFSSPLTSSRKGSRPTLEILSNSRVVMKRASLDVVGLQRCSKTEQGLFVQGRCASIGVNRGLTLWDPSGPRCLSPLAPRRQAETVLS